ncbi:coat protein [ssRNA phage SRR7976299_4]|uniref:Coat protein n=1 Tax=ssRNA phage SRR7976299_4 TaxID=2786644 RepID=A0A8S5L5A7_9VIRU|nr:coat protein [ssRNA phage SRR7976299_4]DAD52636.1 TPA_asm: coat protein [ssRNA phage SRR7976299_4]
MAISFNFGTGATGTAKSLSLLPWAYTTAFRNVSDNGSVARMTDILTPLDKKTSVKITLDKIANVYTTLADGTVPISEQSSNTSGQTVFCELKTVATKTVGDATVQLPMVARIELRIPNDSAIAESDINTLVLATYAALCDASGNPVVVTEKMRGALTPAGI